MPVKKVRRLNVKKAVFNGSVVIALFVIGFYFLNPKEDIDKNISKINTNTKIENSISDNTPQDDKYPTNQSPKPLDNTIVDTEQQNQAEKASSKKNDSKVDAISQAEKEKSTDLVAKPAVNGTKQTNSNLNKPQVSPEPPQIVESVNRTQEVAIVIQKSDITAQAKFYPYKLNDIKLEVITVKASDGTIRTALNTCQVCFDSGRGYYVQVGEYLVCQNCKNKFHIDQVEKVKGGCNPVPIQEENKKDLEDSITISKEYLVGQKGYFSNWKKP